ncbi:MAG: type II toxin-antitoxin system Phd/YefM family antitoxin [Eggerthellaceae bacterium]|nr:type II toxin-antitoxin system Phd/YefM family antitoxin [Eggerthellaceae bacterium]
MLATNYSDLRGNLKSYLDRVSDNYETLIVTRKGDRNVVMMSEESYENILENMHVLGNKENYDWLMESKSQLESGLTEMHDLVEVPDGEE